MNDIRYQPPRKVHSTPQRDHDPQVENCWKHLIWANIQLGVGDPTSGLVLSR